MTNRKKLTIMAILIVLIVIIILTLIFLFLLKFNKQVLLAPTEKKDFCSDSDSNEIDQSKVFGRVIYIKKECNWDQINKINNSGDFCTWELTYNDYCLDESTLKEKICTNNIVDSIEIICSNECKNGKCS